jgi:hypothetical protein
MEGTALYNELIGQNGLVLFTKIPPTVDRLHRLSLDLLPNASTLDPLEITKLEMVPVDIDDNTYATGVDDVSVTADPSDIGYQSKFWIMAPCGNDPEGNRCSDDIQIKIPMEPESKLRMDCTLANSEYRHPVGSAADSPAVPIGQGLASAVRWRGTGTESGDHTPIYKLGDAQKQVELPVGIKVMKRRTVKVAVHEIASVVPGRADDRPGFMPTKSKIVEKLNEIFGLQLNAYFTAEILPVEPIRFDTAGANSYPGFTFKVGSAVPVPDNRLLDYQSWNTPEASLITANRTGDYDIHLFLVGGATPIICYQASAENPMELESSKEALGFANGFVGENYCIVDADRDAMKHDLDGNPTDYYLPEKDRSVLAVVETIAHEIGHIMVGSGHPDDNEGDAPLIGTDRTKRLMCSGLRSSSESKLLVKKEWDKAETWLSTRPNGDN